MKTEPVIGLDFGTTNSAIAIAGSDRQATLATFAGDLATFRSILYFPAKERGHHSKTLRPKLARKRSTPTSMRTPKDV